MFTFDSQDAMFGAHPSPEGWVHPTSSFMFDASFLIAKACFGVDRLTCPAHQNSKSGILDVNAFNRIFQSKCFTNCLQRWW